MESLQIKTGQISLQILDDLGNERGIFTFNPSDVNSAKRVYDMQRQVAEKEVEFDEKAANCKTPEDKIQFLCEYVDYFCNIIDEVFGEGTSKLLFGDAKTFSMFDDFFQGIMPYYQKASKQRISKYVQESGK